MSPFLSYRQSADLSNQANQHRRVYIFPGHLPDGIPACAPAHIPPHFSHAPAPRPYPRANTPRHTAAPCGTSHFQCRDAGTGRLSIYSSSSCRPWPGIRAPKPPQTHSSRSGAPSRPLPRNRQLPLKKRPTGHIHTAGTAPCSTPSHLRRKARLPLGVAKCILHPVFPADPAKHFHILFGKLPKNQSVTLGIVRQGIPWK